MTEEKITDMIMSTRRVRFKPSPFSMSHISFSHRLVGRCHHVMYQDASFMIATCYARKASVPPQTAPLWLRHIRFPPGRYSLAGLYIRVTMKRGRSFSYVQLTLSRQLSHHAGCARRRNQLAGLLSFQLHAPHLRMILGFYPAFADGGCGGSQSTQNHRGPEAAKTVFCQTGRATASLAHLVVQVSSRLGGDAATTLSTQVTVA